MTRHNNVLRKDKTGVELQSEMHKTLRQDKEADDKSLKRLKVPNSS